MNTQHSQNVVKNGDKPASPLSIEYYPGCTGLTKREHACITLGVPDSGDPELDAIIRQANRNKLAAMAMQASFSNRSIWEGHSPAKNIPAIATESVMIADALLAELEKTE